MVVEATPKKMRPSLKWGLRVSGALLALALVVTFISMIVEGRLLIELVILLTYIPLVVTFGVFTTVSIEVVRLFVLLVRFLERRTGDPGWQKAQS
jgi:hypothetical protein